ncbi:MAG: HAD family phosphatase [Bacteroidaceae bacterium]|nr:HAD family phosphatase [Bacteroidaceae bacterium]MBP9637799.1 HAD family phosphatase [Bacteroidaceae bacterium]
MKEPCSYTTLLFDFGGVLIDLDKQRCLDQFAALGITSVGNLLNDCHQQGFFGDFERGLISKTEFCDHIRALVPSAQLATHPISDEAIFEAWCSFLLGIPVYKLEALLELKNHYRLLLLSNVCEPHWEWTCQHDFSLGGRKVGDFFERCYLSYELGAAKPERSVFERIIADSKLIPEETLFLDDSSVNCEIGRSFGLATYQPAPREDWRGIFPELRIND